MSVVSVVCCQVEFSVWCRSLVQRSPAEYVCVTERDQVHQWSFTLTTSRETVQTKKKGEMAI